MIHGQFTSNGRPMVTATVGLPGINAYGPVTFLLDTGATKTVIHPKDARTLEIDFEKLKNETYSLGVGGRAKAFMERAELIFREADELTRQEFSTTIAIAEPSPHNFNYPSLLGRDILNQWTTLYDPRNNSLTLFR